MSIAPIEIRKNAARTISSSHSGYMRFFCKAYAAAVVTTSLGFGACVAITQPKLPHGAEQMSRPAVYSRWWRMVEGCSGRARDIESIRWYRIPGSSFNVGGQEAAGEWKADRIIVAGDAVHEGQVVRHEMLHALLATTRHPRTAFLGSCASIVACPSKCVEDAGNWTAPSEYTLLDPDSLRVTTELEFTPPDADNERWLTEWVSVHNAGARARLVTAPGDVRRPHTFAYQVWGSFGAIQGGIVAFDSSALFFAPFETKRWLFEFRLAPRLSQYTTPVLLPPGAYKIRGSYGRNWSPTDTITLAP